MIIYHTAPIRCFPFLAEQMAGMFPNSYHFRMPIRASNVADHRFGMLHNVIAYDHTLTELPRRSLPHNGFPSDVLSNGIDFVDPERLSDIDFLYGVFDGGLIRKRDGDFVFTIVSEPVRHVYDIFDYLTFVNATATGAERIAEGVDLFDGIVAAGLECFVDRFLDGDRSIVVGDRTFHLIEDFFRFNLTVAYDFVGAEAQLTEAVAALGSRLGIALRCTERMRSRHSSIATDSRYRYHDLRRHLRPEIERYETLLVNA